MFLNNPAKQRMPGIPEVSGHLKRSGSWHRLVRMSIMPPPLRSGDTIGIMAPSGYIEPESLAPGIAALESRGFSVFVHPQTWARDRQSAGTHAQKIAALHALWADSDIKAIMAAGGGNRALHLLDALDYDLIRSLPKAFIGHSDVTALLNAIHAHTGLVTFHGPVLKFLREDEKLDSLLAALGGAPHAPDMSRARILRPGCARGPLIGGNLAIVQYLAGTSEMPDPAGAILFVEEVAEELSKIDRMFLHLRRTGVMGALSGLVLGGFDRLYETGRPFGFTLEDLVLEHVQGTDYPIVMDGPFGHGDALETFPVGRVARLGADEKDGIYLNFE